MVESLLDTQVSSRPRPCRGGRSSSNEPTPPWLGGSLARDSLARGSLARGAGAGPLAGSFDGRYCVGAGRSGSTTATGRLSSSGFGRGCWCGGQGPATGCPAIRSQSTTSGQAKIVGLFPVFGAFSISSKIRGLPRLCPSDSIAIVWPLSGSGAGFSWARWLLRPFFADVGALVHTDEMGVSRGSTCCRPGVSSPETSLAEPCVDSCFTV